RSSRSAADGSRRRRPMYRRSVWQVPASGPQIKIKNALRRHDPFRPIAVVLVPSTDLFSGMGDEIDLLNQAPLFVRGKKIRVAHADSDIVDPDRPRSPECHFVGFSQADHVGVAPFIRLDAAGKKFVREPEVIDVARITAFLVVPFGAPPMALSAGGG